MYETSRNYPLPEGMNPLTCGQLHPAADLVHRPSTAEEEESEAANARQDQYHGHPDEEGRCLEGAGGDGAELGEAALTGQVPGQSVPYTVMEQTEVTSLRRVYTVSNPVGLYETHHIDYGEEDGEDCPKNPNGAGVPNVVGLVDLGSLRGRKHCCRSTWHHYLVLDI